MNKEHAPHQLARVISAVTSTNFQCYERDFETSPRLGGGLPAATTRLQLQ